MEKKENPFEILNKLSTIHFESIMRNSIEVFCFAAAAFFPHSHSIERSSSVCRRHDDDAQWAQNESSVYFFAFYRKRRRNMFLHFLICIMDYSCPLKVHCTMLPGRRRELAALMSRDLKIFAVFVRSISHFTLHFHCLADPGINLITQSGRLDAVLLGMNKHYSICVFSRGHKNLFLVLSVVFFSSDSTYWIN